MQYFIFYVIFIVYKHNRGEYTMLADYHVHSEFSDDSVYPMEEVIQDAIAMGLDEICFTDHVDYGVKDDWGTVNEIKYRGKEPLMNVDYPVYVSRIKEMQLKYSKIDIKMGLEFGVQMHTIPQFEKLFTRYPFDYILLSIHQVENQEFWTQDFQKGRTQDEYIKRYYEEMLNVVRNYKNYSVLAHMDLITRYDKNGDYPFEKISNIIEEILKVVIADRKGLEVNTSSHRYGLSDLTPSRDILKLYKQLGGEIITLGSDSHKKEDLGAYIKETKSELIKMGFDTYCTYEKMKPIFHDLNE